MLIKRKKPTTGTWFAWRPVWTPDGTVWLEWVNFYRNDDALDIHPWRYTRRAPKAYDETERADRLDLPDSFRAYMTPPNPKSFCKNFRTNGPTPCHYPSCKYLDEVGVERCTADKTAFGEW